MKKSMKKVLALALAIIMTLTVLIGCGGETKKDSYTVGMIFYGTDDALGKSVYAYVNHAAELLGVTMKWVVGDFDSASQLKSAENLISAGVDALMWLPIEDNANSQIGQLCADNGVYFSIMYRDIANEDIKTAVQNNPYFVSDCNENDTESAAAMVQVLANLGCTKMGTTSLDATSGLTFARNTGMMQGVDATGITVVGSFQGSNTGDPQTYINGITNLLNINPDMDSYFMISGSLGVGNTIISTLNSLVTPGKVKIAGFDTYDGMKADFEAGWLAAIAGGMAPDALFSFLCIYNKLDGTPLSDEPIWLKQKQVIVTSAEDCDAYASYVDTPNYIIYSDDQIKNLTGRYNPDVTLQDMTTLMEQFSIEWIVNNLHS